ncbi:MAG: response regulator [Desulfosarcinaceae bacterium]
MNPLNGKEAILVVDDERLFRRMLCQKLTRSGFPCTEAASGEEALKLLDQKVYDVVITDIRMQGISGIELLRAVKTEYDSDVIVITGYSEEYSYENIVEIGASDFMIKPFSPDEMLLRLNRVLHIRRLLEERNLAYSALQAVSQELIKAQEHERLRIARDLHDRVAQDLSALKISMDTLFDDRGSIDPALRHKMTALCRILGHSINSLREIAYNLRPPMLDQLGLRSAIFQFGQDFTAKSGVEVDFSSAGMDELSLSPDVEINLFRLIQEALANVQKHAQAGEVIIRLVASFPNVVLRIEDDGIGFDVAERMAAALCEKRMGLKSMQERVSLMGGTMTIKSVPNKGARLVIKIPYDALPEARSLYTLSNACFPADEPGKN